MNKVYTTGICPKCGKKSPLKYGLCPKCQDINTNEMPDIFKEIFGMKGGQDDMPKMRK